MPEEILPGLHRGDVGVARSEHAGDAGRLALQAAVSIATGRNVGGLWPEAPEAGPAIYVSALDGESTIAAKLTALAALAPGETGRLTDRLHVLVDTAQRLVLFQRDGDRVRASALMHRLAAHLTGKRPRLVVFDMFVRYLNRAGLSWDDPAEREAALTLMRRLAEDLDTAILLVPAPWPSVPTDDIPALVLEGTGPDRFRYSVDGAPRRVPIRRDAAGCLLSTLPR